MIRQLKPNELDNCHLATGNIKGWEMAEKVFGWKDYHTNYSDAFVYFFRRFGAPQAGSDDYKQLCNYFITTPTKGFYLNASFSSYGFLSFSLYATDKNLYFDLISEQRKQIDEYRARRTKWAKENYPNLFEIYELSEDDLNTKFSEWFEENKKRFAEWEDTPENWKKCHEIFFRESEKSYEEIVKKYPEEYVEDENYPQPLNDKVSLIFEKALRELLNPVYIRDTYCNIKGRVRDEDLNSKTKTRAYYKYSGYGYISTGVQNKV